MEHRPSLAPGIIFAVCLAGPIFTTATMLALLYADLPKPIVVSGQDILSFLLALFFSTFFGAILALIPVLVGATLMRAVADRHEMARDPLVWIGVGALCGIALAFWFEADHPAVAFGLVVTSASCARICRFPLSWD